MYYDPLLENNAGTISRSLRVIDLQVHSPLDVNHLGFHTRWKSDSHLDLVFLLYVPLLCSVFILYYSYCGEV